MIVRLWTILKALKFDLPTALCILLVLLDIPEFTRTWEFEYELYDETMGYPARSVSVGISSKIWGKSVTLIGLRAFGPIKHADGGELSSMIPDSVTTISDYTFAYAGLRTEKILAGVLPYRLRSSSACNRLTDIEAAAENKMYQVDGVAMDCI